MVSEIDSVIRKLRDLKVVLLTESNEKKLFEISDGLSFSVPSWAINIFNNSNLINTKYECAILGFEALSKNDVIEFYNNRKSSEGFYGAYNVDENLNAGEDMYILLEEDFQNKLIEPVVIKNLASLLPIFSFQGDYIVLNQKENEASCLMILSDGYSATILAPDIESHLNDLIEGISEGCYKIDDEELIYPSSWYQRTKVRSGELEMDEYGEIEE